MSDAFVAVDRASPARKQTWLIEAPSRLLEKDAPEVGPRTFTLRTMADRVAAVGDLWSGMSRKKLSLGRARAKLEG